MTCTELRRYRVANLLPPLSLSGRVIPSRKIALNSNGEVNYRELARRPCSHCGRLTGRSFISTVNSSGLQEGVLLVQRTHPVPFCLQSMWLKKKECCTVVKPEPCMWVCVGMNALWRTIKVYFTSRQFTVSGTTEWKAPLLNGAFYSAIHK